MKKNNSECIWIGPPDAGRKNIKDNLSAGVSEIRSLVEKSGCAFIDSTSKTQYSAGKGDGIHYGPQESAAWGKKVVAEMEKLPQVARAREKADKQDGESKAGTATEAGAVR